MGNCNSRNKNKKTEESPVAIKVQIEDKGDSKYLKNNQLWSQQLVEDNNSQIIEYFINKYKQYSNYKININFKIISTKSNCIFDWCEIQSNGKKINGISLYQSSHNYGSSKKVDYGDYRYIWLEVYDNQGNAYYYHDQIIKLGVYDISIDKIEITIHINQDGIICYYCDSEKIKKIKTETSSRDYIFNKVENRLDINIYHDIIKCYSFKLMTDDITESHISRGVL